MARKKYAANPVPTKLTIEADDQELMADGSDATRVVFKVVDQAGNLMPYLNEVIEFEVEGPGTIIGPKLTGLIGGCIATWVKTTGEEGTIKIKGVTTRFESETVEIKVKK